MVDESSMFHATQSMLDLLEMIQYADDKNKDAELLLQEALFYQFCAMTDYRPMATLTDSVIESPRLWGLCVGSLTLGAMRDSMRRKDGPKSLLINLYG